LLNFNVFFAFDRILLWEYLILIIRPEILLLIEWAAIINHDSLDLGSPHRVPQRERRDVMAKMLSAIAVAVLLATVGLANAKEPVKLTDKQLNKVTAGAFNANVPIAAALLGNGAGPGGINQFSPSTATVTQTQTALGLNLFTIH
jgi:hypothetical protein